MELCQQSDVSAFQQAVQVSHSFYSKKQTSFNFMSAVTMILQLEKIKSVSVLIFSPIFHEVMGPDAMTLVFSMLSFKPASSFFFIFIKRLFTSSSLSAIRVVSSAYLRFLIFLPAILSPACASYSPAFLMMYSAYKLNRRTIYSLDIFISQFEPVHCSMSSSNYVS